MRNLFYIGTECANQRHMGKRLSFGFFHRIGFKLASLLRLTLHLILVSCLPQPLRFPVVENYPDKGASYYTESASNEAEDPHQLPAQNIYEIATAKNLKTFEEKLFELLWARSEGAKTAVGLKEIRFLQERYLDYLEKQPAKEVVKIKGTYEPSNELQSSNCKLPADQFKWIKQDSIKQYTYMHKRAVTECYFHNSKVVENLLNSLLVGDSASLTFDGVSHEISNLEDFPKLVNELGASLKVSYRIYFAPFVRIYSVNEERDESEIPTPFLLDAHIESPAGRSVYIPAVHSEVLFQMQHPEWGHAEVKIYFSDKGFVFDDDDLQLPQWTGLRTLHVFNEIEVQGLLKNIPLINEGFQKLEHRFGGKLHLAGFGLLGVCNDGSALLVRSVMGEDFILPFPLVRSNRLIADDIPLADLWKNLKTDLDEAQLEMDPKNRFWLLKDRLLQSYSFIKSSPSQFFEYEELIREIEGLQQ